MPAPPSILTSHPKALAVSQRIEAKYFLTEVEAELVRDYISEYTVSDLDHPEYTVMSIYLDSHDNQLFHSSDCGEKNRFKLRVRGYGIDPDRPVFAEVKQRIGSVVKKHRSMLDRSTLGSLHWSALPDRNALTSPDNTRECENLLLFSQLAQSWRTEPRICVGYRRAAFVSAFDEPVRVTLDDRIAYAPVPDNPADLWARKQSWKILDDLPVVLEIKFTNNFPFWIHRLVQRFELRRVSLAKYVTCVSRMERECGPMPQMENF